MKQIFFTLVLRSLTEPAKVARWLLNLRLSNEALWLSFALVVVLNTLAFSTAMLFENANLPGFLARPSTFGALQAGSVSATMIALFWAGRLLGGSARFTDVAVLVIWMQVLRFLVQILFFVLGPLTGNGTFVASLTSVVGFWILLNFLNEAHSFGSLPKAFLAVIIGLMGMAFALSILLTLLGVDPTGINGYV